MRIAWGELAQRPESIVETSGLRRGDLLSAQAKSGFADVRPREAV